MSMNKSEVLHPVAIFSIQHEDAVLVTTTIWDRAMREHVTDAIGGVYQRIEISGNALTVWLRDTTIEDIGRALRRSDAPGIDLKSGEATDPLGFLINRATYYASIQRTFYWVGELSTDDVDAITGGLKAYFT